MNLLIEIVTAVCAGMAFLYAKYYSSPYLFIRIGVLSPMLSFSLMFVVMVSLNAIPLEVVLTVAVSCGMFIASLLVDEWLTAKGKEQEKEFWYRNRYWPFIVAATLLLIILAFYVDSRRAVAPKKDLPTVTTEKYNEAIQGNQKLDKETR